MVARCRRPAAAACPHTGQPALLADPGFILPPDLERFVGSVGRQSGRNQVCESVCTPAVSSDISNPSRDDIENPSTSATVMPRRVPVRVSP